MASHHVVPANAGTTTAKMFAHHPHDAFLILKLLR
jgi:hypothetical protein